MSSGITASARPPWAGTSDGAAPRRASASSAAPSPPQGTSTSASPFCDVTPATRPPGAACPRTTVSAVEPEVARAWMAMPFSRANSTASAFSTLAPARASSCISS